MRKRKWIGNKLPKKYQEEIKKCVIAVIEDCKVELVFNGQSQITSN
jgi:hypothetical protein